MPRSPLSSNASNAELFAAGIEPFAHVETLRARDTERFQKPAVYVLSFLRASKEGISKAKIIDERRADR